MVKHEFKEAVGEAKASTCSSLKLLSKGGRCVGLWGAWKNAPASQKSCADALSWAPAASKGKAEEVKRNETPGANCLTTLVQEKTKKAEERTTAGGVRQR